MVYRNLGWPWGRSPVPWPTWKWQVKELPAACPAENHFGHRLCWPAWRKEVARYRAIILAEPVLLPEGWKVLVAVRKRYGKGGR